MCGEPTHQKVGGRKRERKKNRCRSFLEKKRKESPKLPEALCHLKRKEGRKSRTVTRLLHDLLKKKKKKKKRK